MQRWIARLLVFVMAVPAFGPLAMASVAQTAPHCERQPARPVMQCHPGMTMAMPSGPPSPETAFNASHSCCENHDCCRGMAAPKWAQLTQVRAHQTLPMAGVARALRAHIPASTFSEVHSARAPPRTLLT